MDKVNKYSPQFNHKDADVLNVTSFVWTHAKYCTID